VRQVRIDLDPQRLRAYQLTPGDVSQALQRANSDMPVGLLTGTKEDAIVRVEGKVKDAKAFADVVVASRNGMVVRLADLGTLVEREREPDSISRVDGVPAISFQVLQAAGREHRRDRPGDQGRRRGAAGRACRRASSCAWSTPTATGSRARSTASSTPDRGRAADDRDRLPVPAQLAQHGDHRADACRSR
jgi:hypothetical protein